MKVAYPTSEEGCYALGVVPSSTKKLRETLTSVEEERKMG